MNRIAPIALLVFGCLVMAVSFLHYAGNALPYPDPTAELLAHQAAEAKKWCLLFGLGMLVSALGGVSLWRQARKKAMNKTRNPPASYSPNAQGVSGSTWPGRHYGTN